jgi:glycosyltransferase involved in cell wall biosynthesis
MIERPNPSVYDLSIVIPTHERRRELHRLLRSVKESVSFTDLRVQIVVVDSSKRISLTGPERETLESPQIKIDYLPCREKGVNAKRNRGIDQAEAAVTLFLDDDCEVSSCDLLTYHLQLHQNNAALLIGGPYENRPQSRVAKAYCNIHDTWRGNTSGVLAPFVGGNLSLKTDVNAPWMRFDESLFFGGTEKELVLRALSQGHAVLYTKLLTLSHWMDMSFFSLMRKAFLQGKNEWILWQRYPQLLSRGTDAFLPDPKSPHRSWMEALYDFFFHVGYLQGRQNGSLLSALSKRLFSSKEPWAPKPGEKPLPPSVFTLILIRAQGRLELIWSRLFYFSGWHQMKLVYGHKLLPWIMKAAKPYFFLKYQYQTRLVPLLKAAFSKN